MEQTRRDRRRALWLWILATLALAFLISALFITYFSSGVAKMRYEQARLVRQNLQLQEQIARKKEFYKHIRDRIHEAQVEIGEEGQKRDLRGLKRFLSRMGEVQKEVVVTALPHGYPADVSRISSAFGYRIHPIYHDRRFHRGIDFPGKIGIPVRATADGIVKMAESTDGGYGNVVKITHNFGFETIYGHMLSNLQVHKGDFIKRGTVIGYLGNTGLSTGPHLHYEVRYLGMAIDPAPFLKLDAQNFPEHALASFRIYWRPLIAAILESFRQSERLHVTKRKKGS